MDTTRYIEKSLAVEGARMVYITAGNPANPPLMMVHGWLSSRHVWRDVIEAFKSAYFCIAVDLLGLGDSDKPKTADYSIAAQARRIITLADALNLQQFSLIGHSMGGQISMYLAAKLAPQRVTKLVNVDGVVTGKLHPYVEQVTKPMMRLATVIPFSYATVRLLTKAKPLAKLQFRPWFHDMDKPPFDFWAVDRRMALQSEAIISNYLLGEAIAAANIEPFLSAVTAKTLVIFGNDDQTVSVSQGVVAANRIPNASLVIIPACGHFPMYEHTLEFLGALKAFL